MSENTTYEVPVHVVIDSHVGIQASSPEEAWEIVQKMSHKDLLSMLAQSLKFGIGHFELHSSWD